MRVYLKIALYALVIAISFLSGPIGNSLADRSINKHLIETEKESS